MAKWKALFNGERKTRALSIAKRIAYRVGKINEVQNTSDLVAAALLYSELYSIYPSQEFKQHLNRFIRPMSNLFESNLSISLHGGLCELGFLFYELAKVNKEYERELSQFCTALDKRLPKISSLASSKLFNDLRSKDYDLVSGISGVALLALTLNKRAIDQSQLEKSLMLLCDMAKKGPYGFVLERSNIIGDLAEINFSYSKLLDCGIAHGFPSALSVLSLAFKSGFSSNHLINTIEQLGDFLCDSYDTKNSGWPGQIFFDECSRELCYERHPVDGWCYGTTGVARSLFLAGKAVGSEKFIDCAIAAIKAVVSRSSQERGLVSPTLCHGKSGLLLVLLRFYQDTGDSEFLGSATELFDELVSTYDDSHKYGYQDLDWDGAGIDSLGLLSGAIGVTLTLLACVSDSEPTWDRILLVS